MKILQTAKAKTIGFLCLWAILLAAGEIILLKYENAPALLQEPPRAWPTGTKIERAAGLPVLLVFLHPQCPCSKATVEQLAVIMTRWQSKLKAQAVFFKPETRETSWVKTSLWDAAERIPGVEVRIDAQGKERKVFHAFSSGQTILYDAQGRLQFYGGITQSRGHVGDSAGQKAIGEILTHKKEGVIRTPVFGCPLINQPFNKKEMAA